MIVDEALVRYAEAHSDPEPALLRELAEVTRARTRAPQMQVGRVEGHLLRLLVAISGARRVLELGTFTGYSALMMAEALPADGRLVTCEIDEEAAAIARAFFARSPHGHKIELRLGPALETIETLEGPFDFVFLDADKQGYEAAYEAVWPRLRAGGLIVADNVLWGGRVLDPERRDETTSAIRRFNERVRKDPRAERVMLTVRDGITLIRKRLESR